MNQSSQEYTSARTARMIHGALTAGCILAGGIFFALRARGQGPRLEGETPVGTLMAVVAVVLVVLGATFFRRRVPERVASQSAEDFWGKTATTTPALVMWSMFEGAALMSLVGYLLTGEIAPAVVAAMAIAALIALRPGRLEYHS
jgi:hypothetical protein